MRTLKELHPYTLVTVLTNLVVNPLTYENFLINVIPEFLDILDFFYPVIPAALLLAGIVLAIVKRDFKGYALGMAINAAVMAWGIAELYSLFTVEPSFDV